jgi:hypothetical protein
LRLPGPGSAGKTYADPKKWSKLLPHFLKETVLLEGECVVLSTNILLIVRIRNCNPEFTNPDQGSLLITDPPNPVLCTKHCWPGKGFEEPFQDSVID